MCSYQGGVGQLNNMIIDDNTNNEGGGSDNDDDEAVLVIAEAISNVGIQVQLVLLLYKG